MTAIKRIKRVDNYSARVTVTNRQPVDDSHERVDDII